MSEGLKPGNLHLLISTPTPKQRLHDVLRQQRSYEPGKTYTLQEVLDWTDSVTSGLQHEIDRLQKLVECYTLIDYSIPRPIHITHGELPCTICQSKS